MNGIKRLAAFCKKTHKNNLLVSNTFATVSLLGVGDVITQYMEHRLADKSSSKMIPQELNMKNSLAKLDVNKSNSCTVVMKEPTKVSFWKIFDWKRSAKLAALGLLLGPLCHYWYIILDRKFPTKSKLVILRKVMLDQLIAAPLCNVLSIVGVFLLEGKYLEEITDTIKEKFLVIYAYDCAVWPVAQAINFGLISPVYRLLYINSISVVWNSILSFLMFD